MDNPENNKHDDKHEEKIGILLNIIFYSMSFLLVGILIYPHTYLYYQKKYNLPSSLNLNKTEIFIEKGKTDRIFVYAINKRVSFKSSDFKVVGVNSIGKIYARKVGKAVIKVKVDGKELKCKVNVININKKKMTLSVGKTGKLRIKGTLKNVKWQSKNEKIAKVSRFGKVTGIEKGKTEIIGAVKGIKISCIITIVK